MLGGIYRLARKNVSRVYIGELYIELTVIGAFVGILINRHISREIYSISARSEHMSRANEIRAYGGKLG